MKTPGNEINKCRTFVMAGHALNRGVSFWKPKERAQKQHACGMETWYRFIYFFFSMDIVDKTFRRHQKSASNLIRRDLETDLSFMAGNKDELVQTARNDYWGSGLSYEPVLVWMMWFPEEMKKERSIRAHRMNRILFVNHCSDGQQFYWSDPKENNRALLSPENGGMASSFKRGVFRLSHFYATN
jgi:hypothetical protein